MILLKLSGEVKDFDELKVVGVYFGISPTYQPKTDEVMVESLPNVTLTDGEYGHIYYRNHAVVIEKMAKKVV